MNSVGTIRWEDVPDQAQVDLLAWFNVSDPEEDDRAMLAELWEGGRFRAWDCPDCGDRCYQGSPFDWFAFQGVLQLDFASYPGNPDVYAPDHIARQCDDCRARGSGAWFTPNDCPSPIGGVS